MRHVDYQKRISFLVDGELDEASARDLLTHLTECPDCMRVYEQIGSLNNTLAKVKISIPDSHLTGKVKALISGEPKETTLGWNISFLKQVPIWALIAILAIGVGDMAGKTLTEALNNEETPLRLETLLQDHGESLSDIVVNFGQGENSQ
ncbi:MAG: zf-HC2 domain-containing protein [Pseudomonadota bacterium]